MTCWTTPTGQHLSRRMKLLLQNILKKYLIRRTKLLIKAGSLKYVGVFFWRVTLTAAQKPAQRRMFRVNAGHWEVGTPDKTQQGILRTSEISMFIVVLTRVQRHHKNYDEKNGSLAKVVWIKERSYSKFNVLVWTGWWCCGLISKCDYYSYSF